MINISVIIPSYNVELYIEDCLRSVLRQTQSALEIICIDDCSNDKTHEIIKKMQVEFPNRIELFLNEENKGATYTRNRGLTVSSGEYVQFLDADDLLFVNKLELQSKKIENSITRPDILAGSCTKILLNNSERKLISTVQDPWCALVSSKLGVTSANLFKREKLLAVKGWADGLQSSQEYEMMFRLLQKKATVEFDSTILNINRERTFGSITKTNPNEMWKRYIALRIKIFEYLRDNNELTNEREQSCINIIFDAIRFLYEYDPKTAIDFHDNYLLGIGKPSITSSTSGKYLSIYKIIGFKGAQLVARLFKIEP